MILISRWEVLIPSLIGRNVAEREKANPYPQRKKVCSEIPIFRQTSETPVPVSACRRAKAICSPVNLDVFIDKTSFKRFCRKTHLMSGPFLRDEV
jgi:hypothetical protein